MIGIPVELSYFPHMYARLAHRCEGHQAHHEVSWASTSESIIPNADARKVVARANCSAPFVFSLEANSMNVLSRRNSRGQGLVEYALIIALVAIVVIAALVLLGPAISSIFVHINSAL